MKKILTLVLILFLLIMLFAGCKDDEPPPTPTPERVTSIRSFTESDEFSWWLRSVNSWEQIRDFLALCEFKQDKELFGVEDYWQTPDQFYHSKKGDCDCFSWFVSYVWVRKLNAYKAWVVWMVEYLPEPRGHMYSVIEKKKGEFTVINARTVLGTFDDIQKTPYAFRWMDPVIVQVDEILVYPEPEVKRPRSAGDTPKTYCPIGEVCP